MPQQDAACRAAQRTGPHRASGVSEASLDRHAVWLFQDFRRAERPEIFQRLFEECGPELLSLLRMKIRQIRLPVDPAELLVDTFSQVFKARHTFRDRGNGSFLRWFMTIAENLLRQRQRESTRRLRREEVAARQIHDPSADPLLLLVERETQAVAQLTYQELRGLIIEAFHALSPRQEQALLLHTVHALSYAEIARRLDISLGAVAMRIKRARDKVLRHVLEQVRRPATKDPPGGAEP
jgi:RNA polymerase sigma-70 factor (ECF subfamily)